MGDLTYGESRVKSAVSLANANPFESLQTLPGSFFDANLNHNGVTGSKLRYFACHLLGIQLCNYLVGAHYTLLSP
jgi:hypothetical protein